MIISTHGKPAKKALAGNYGKGFPADMVERTKFLLQELEIAAELDDLRTLPSNRLKVLSGDRLGQHSLRINDQFRICFIWTAAGPERVEITDYH